MNFDDIDAEILKDRCASRRMIDDINASPRVGDAVIMPDGTLCAVSNVDGARAQIAKSGRGSFHLNSGGSMEFSGTHELVVLERQRFELMPYRVPCPLRTWFFHHGDVGPNRAVDCDATVRQWRYEGA